MKILLFSLFLCSQIFAEESNFSTIKNQMIELTEVEIKISTDFKKCLEKSKTREDISTCRSQKRESINKILNKEKKPYVKK